MTVSPASGTRVSVPLQTHQLLSQLTADQTSIQSYYDQLSTGRRLQRLGDDPAAANRALGLQSSIRYGEQLVRNATEAAGFYAATDEMLARIDSALIEARGASVQAAQGVLPEEERESLAIQLRQILDQVLSASNTTFRDHQLLGGILESKAAFTQEGSTVVFNGTTATGQTRAAQGIGVQTSLAIDEALGNRQEIVSSDPLKPGLNAETRLLDARHGKGVQAGVIRISDGSQWQNVDLSAAASIGDIKQLLEAVDLGGRELAVTLRDDGFQIEYLDGLPGTLAIEDAAGGRMAKELNIENANGLDPPPLISEGLTPRVTLATKLASLNNGAGMDVSAGLQILQGQDVFEVDLSGAQTLGDVLTAINRSGADVRAVLNESDGGIDLLARRAGVDYSIGENGALAATALGIRSSTRDTRLDSLGHGQGIPLDPNAPELTILRPDGTQLDLEFDGLQSVGDVLDAINNHPANQDTRRVIASLAAYGNGIQLIAPPGAGAVTVRQPPNGTAGVRLGLIAKGASEAAGSVQNGQAMLVGSDYLPREPGGAIDSLLRLEAATRAGDVREIGRLQQELDGDLKRSVSARGRVGVWAQNLEILRDTASDQVVAFNGQLSEAVDTDFASVISQLTSRQTSLEASMRLIGQTSQLSVLNFL